MEASRFLNLVKLRRPEAGAPREAGVPPRAPGSGPRPAVASRCSLPRRRGGRQPEAA